MARKHAGTGGSRFTLPLQTRFKKSGAAMEAVSDVLYQNLIGEHYVFEDFNAAAFDIANSQLAVYDDSTAGTPTAAQVVDATGGQFQIRLAADSEAETAALTQGDNLMFAGNKPFYFETRVQVVHTMAAVQKIVIGVGSDANATLDSVARNAWFLLAASFALLWERDDATTDSDDQSTGITIVEDTWRTYAIENGADGFLHYSVADGDGAYWNTVAKVPHAFGANNIQPFVGAQKASGTTRPEMLVDYVLMIGSR